MRLICDHAQIWNHSVAVVTSASKSGSDSTPMPGPVATLRWPGAYLQYDQRLAQTW